MSREAIEQGRPARRRGRHPAGLALPRYAHAGRPVRLRPAAVLSAAPEPVRGRRDRRRRLGPHAEDRLAAVDQSLQSVPRRCEVAITRRAKGYDGRLHPEEALTRDAGDPLLHDQQRPLACSSKTEIGSLEAGKQADFVVVDRDLLTCPEDQIKDARAIATYLDGKEIFQRDSTRRRRPESWVRSVRSVRSVRCQAQKTLSTTVFAA